MKGSEYKFIKYMEGSDKRFVIPVYQRNYDWKTENCKQLYDDLIKIIREKRKSHFFGSIVSVYNPEGHNEEFLVIDGQQRLTTVSLLFLAMYNLMEEGKLIPEQANLKQRIYEEYLVDKWQPEDTRIKLKPVKNDQKAFNKLFRDSDEYVKGSNLTINYNYFYDRIQKQEMTLDELFDAICRLEIISITLNNEDNPQLIFESLNSTGLDLSEGDKIRNYILMGLPTKEQEDYYERYWNRIEECTEYDVSSFIRDYLSVKQQITPSQRKIYLGFKNYVAGLSMTTEDLLKDILAYAKRYEVLLKGKTEDTVLNACIYRLNRLETTVTRPFFLEVLRMCDENKINALEVQEIFLVTESYLFRRAICSLPTNALNKIFLMLHREIIRFENNENDYVEKFKYAILMKKEKARFPKNNEFIEEFSKRQVYMMNSKNKIYMLERFENFGTKEDKDIYHHFDDGKYSIEHIMPKQLTPGWKKDLGNNYEQVHEEWLHRIANLTLTAYNSKYSNSSFDEKKNTENGFKDSGIRMNTYIASKDRWTLAELQERNDYLMGRALEIWALPETAYKASDKELEFYPLSDDIDLSGRKIAKFSYRNMEQPVRSWVEMFVRVVKLLHAEDKSILTKLAYEKEKYNELSLYVSDSPSQQHTPERIDEDVYFECNTSTWKKQTLLKKLFKLYNIDQDELTFYLREENSIEEKELITEKRYAVRKGYWTVALQHMNEDKDQKGPFSKISPSKDNWISGKTGIKGIGLYCIATNDSARVEIVMNKTKAEENKATFDELFTHKDEIEEAIGGVLSWNRGKNIKSSKVYVELKEVSVANETDWIQMANFHKQWSDRFYRVILPYLKESLK